MFYKIFFRCLVVFYLFIGYLSFAQAYYVDENGKDIPISKDIATEIDDIEIKDGEALDQSEIDSIVNTSDLTTADL